MQIKEGMIVKSDAGHDQNSFYVVVKIVGGFAFIADGRRRKVEKPKRKNYCHLKKTNTVLENALYLTNKNIKRELSRFLGSETVAD